MEKLTRDKHSSLLQRSVNYRRKKFYNIGPWAYLSETTELVCVWGGGAEFDTFSTLIWQRWKTPNWFQNQFGIL
jgi:hypothetical protein